MQNSNGATPWKSKIVGHDRVAPETLTPNPLNHRTHPQGQRNMLAASIRDVGFIRSVTVNQTSGNLIDGHERLTQAIETGQEFIDVEYVELTEREEKLALATMDSIGELAATDPEKLEELLHGCSTGEEALQELLAEMADEAGAVAVDDPQAEWEGMPEFEQEDKTAFRSIIVHFKDKEAVDEFNELVKPTITEKTKMIWFPDIEIEPYIDKQYANKS